ncbi:MAG: hypothetical protein FWD05_14650 [Oscillospiraceae bacterium]|nr:hypothetical protein [Oscillospiraceae bacterium]
MKDIMKSKTTKIIVDICMTMFLVLSFIRWEDSNFIFHAVVGTACTVFFTAHVCIHWKWIKATTKSLFSGKLSKTLRWKYAVDMLLLIVWSIAIVTGFLAVGNFSFSIEAMAGFGRLHGITSRIGLLPLAIHVIQHIPQIKSYIGIRKKRER